MALQENIDLILIQGWDQVMELMDRLLDVIILLLALLVMDLGMDHQIFHHLKQGFILCHIDHHHRLKVQHIVQLQEQVNIGYLHMKCTIVQLGQVQVIRMQCLMVDHLLRLII